MFRTVLVHLEEQPFISCTSHLVYADTSGCCVVAGRTGPIGNTFLYIFINMNEVLYRMCAHIQAICLFLFINNEISLIYI